MPAAPFDRAGYSLVPLANGTQAVYSSSYDEKMHPGLGPQAEADLLYVRQLRIPERLREGAGEFVIWDVGLGAAANAAAALRAGRDVPRVLRVVSFDDTDEPLRFALQNAAALGYPAGYEPQIEELLRSRRVQFPNGRQPVDWEFHLGDFPALIANAAVRLPAPDAIFFDAFSPAKNPAMWTLSVFRALFGRLDPRRPCSLTTYSRSTMLRATLLLAGFYVGTGLATGRKEETTVAANALELLEQPLERRWLERASRSGSAEPLTEAGYRQAPLSPGNLEKLHAHPQFAG